MRSIATILLFSCALPATLHAQNVPRTASPSLFAGYTLMGSNTGPAQCGCFRLNGGNGELAFPVARRLEAIASLNGQTTPNAIGNGAGLSLITLAGGARLMLTRVHAEDRSRISPFAETLAGFTHGFHSFFPTTPSSNSANAFTLIAGGGIDLRITQHIALRPAQIDYVFTNFVNGTNGRQNNLRVGAGIVLHQH